MKPYSLGSLQIQILIAILSLEDDAYGMKIIDFLEERTGREISVGALYTSLKRLEERGYIQARKGKPTNQPGGKAKTFFKLTSSGRAALEESHSLFEHFPYNIAAQQA